MHVPVLLKEVLEILKPKKGEFFIDGTLDGGGHALEIIKRLGHEGIFLGVDWDPEMVQRFRKKLKEENFQELPRILLVNDNYLHLPTILKKKKLPKADGLFLDLGVSGEQLEFSGRGFSFRSEKEEPLLMNYYPQEKPAYQFLEELSEKKLAQIIKEYSGERYALRIARAIKRNLPIRTNKKLSKVIEEAVPRNYEHGRIHPATRTFQALRILVNRELENLQGILEKILEILKPGGRLGIISFHSLEDRLVKIYFRNFKKQGLVEILTKKPIRPSFEEIQKNPKSRSARFRAVKIL